MADCPTIQPSRRGPRRQRRADDLGRGLCGDQRSICGTPPTEALPLLRHPPCFHLLCTPILSLRSNSSENDSDRAKLREERFISLFGEIQRAVEICLSPEGSQHVTLMIDDVSLVEVDANGSSNLVLDFLHYCNSLRAQFGCSLVALNHDDVYSTMDEPKLLLHMEYLADMVIKIEPLDTGLAAAVHGQLTVTNRGLEDGKTRNKVQNFHFRVKDSGAEYFYPGSKGFK
ncbi:elongator complex protein 6 [Striga asiatica]|uniref:Elongator complex protein 6 n=1 Tax=Striga asiatica TaxID=4170 RepID=A0A5A7PJG8_STRAF|nr:elongator complex protein 6 [Striga asiatica]